jgi:hypothetical protein
MFEVHPYHPFGMMTAVVILVLLLLLLTASDAA